jgi:hypothetical protein
LQHPALAQPPCLGARPTRVLGLPLIWALPPHAHLASSPTVPGAPTWAPQPPWPPPNADDYEMLCRLDETVENKKGASALQLAALPTQTVPAGGLLGDGGERLACSVCLEVRGAAWTG